MQLSLSEDLCDEACLVSEKKHSATVGGSLVPAQDGQGRPIALRLQRRRDGIRRFASFSLRVNFSKHWKGADGFFHVRFQVCGSL